MKQIILTIAVLAITMGIHAQSNATQIEYFLDVDNGVGLNTVLDVTSPNVDITEVVLANIPSSTSIGYHKLYFRIKDADGNWGHTFRKHIEIVKPLAQNNLVTGEYFIDEDPEINNAISFNINPQEKDIEQAFTAQILASTPLGYHKLYGRVKDANNNWSHTFRKNIEVYLNPVTNLVEIEYFFGDDLDSEFGNNTKISIDTPKKEGTWTFNVPYPTGNYSFDDALFVRAKDSNSNWSITTTLDEVASLSTEDNVLKSTRIYPNPFSETISILLTNTISIKNITIYNTLGKEVYKDNSNTKDLNLGFLPQGVYFLQLSTNTAKGTFKIVKK